MLILKLTSPEGDVRTSPPRSRRACGKTNLAMLEPTDPRLEGRDGRRRHRWMRFGRRRPAARDQPGGRLLRRRARHRPEDQPPTRSRRCTRNCIFTNVAPDRRRRRVVGGPDRRAAGAPDRLEGQRLDAGVGGARRSHPNAASPRRPRSARRSRDNWEDPAGVPDRRDPVRRPPRHERPAGQRVASTGSTACSSAPRCRRSRPPRPRAPSARCAATRSRCCRSAATTWPTTGATGSTVGQGHDVAGQAAADLPGELVPQGRRRAGTCGQASARTAASSSGSSTGSRAQAEAVDDADRPRRLRRARSNLDGLGLIDARRRRAVRGRRRVVAGRGRPHRGVLRAGSATAVPAELCAELADLRARLASA